MRTNMEHKPISWYRILLSLQKVPSRPFPVCPSVFHPKANHCSNFLYCPFVCYRTSYKWSHAVWTLLCKISFIQHDVLRIFHVVACVNSLFFFKYQSGISLYENTTVCFFISLLIDAAAISSFGQLLIKLLWSFL